jgi:transglutaminase-like putative cysteine protease
VSAHAAAPGTAAGFALVERAWARAAARVGSPLRLVSFCALASFGALHWAALVDPSQPLRVLAPVALAALGAPVAVAAGRVKERAGRAAILTVLAVAQVAGALLAAGVPLRLLLPDAWGDLASGVSQGLSALPGLNVPYGGEDEWIHTVLLLGGGLIAVVAGWLTFLRSAALRAGPPLAAATQLVALYTVPIVEHGPRLPFLGGAVLALLLVAFLWGERLSAGEARLAAGLAVAATLVAVVLAPRVDGSAPLLDYQRIAEGLEARGSTSFTWTHSYGPLDWPRDGREVLRVRARTPAYWKAASLEEFDGVRWRSTDARGFFSRDSEFAAGDPAWHQIIRVVVRNMRSSEYIAAGTTEEIIGSPRAKIPATPGTWRTGQRSLQPGDSYRARVYVPRPSAAQLRTSGVEYPAFVAPDLDISLPEVVGGPAQVRPLDPGRPVGPPAVVRFAPFGTSTPTLARSPRGFPSDTGAEMVRASRWRRAFALARDLAAGTATPYDFVRAVQRRVSGGATYSERPAGHALPLDAFLFDDRTGYCQQFSGAMALLLRMGGVPARVASGFTPGSLDRRRRDYVVRDIDAHSWVEAYFPGYGWVPFDPTPAVAPPRAQAIGDRSVSAATGDLADTGGTGGGAADRPQPGAAGESGARLWWIGGVVAGVALAALLAFAVRRRGRAAPPGGPELAELVRALRRTGRAPAPHVTLRSLELVLDTDEGGSLYLRALREQRFGGHAPGPTAVDRRALRRSLAAGLGFGGRLRSWWALPPRWIRRRRTYTAV